MTSDTRPHGNHAAIDIDRLTEVELIDLNRRIVQRLRMLQQVRAHHAMLKFNIGQRVWFFNDNGQQTAGVITRYNRKTVSIISDHGQRWNVSPSLLQSDG